MNLTIMCMFVLTFSENVHAYYMCVLTMPSLRFGVEN